MLYGIGMKPSKWSLHECTGGANAGSLVIAGTCSRAALTLSPLRPLDAGTKPAKGAQNAARKSTLFMIDREFREEMNREFYTTGPFSFSSRRDPMVANI